jgi:hypothetical protein
MAKILHCHPSRTAYEFHLLTDLDFWDARRILKELAVVKRNFGKDPPGNEFPTQIVASGLTRTLKGKIESRLKRAIVSPPRHVIVDAIIEKGYFEFDPLDYYPHRWTRQRMYHFTYHRLPLDSAFFNSPFKTVRVSWTEGKIRIERVQREKKYDPVIGSREEALRRLRVPSCF